jgi:adenylate cyclase
MKLKLGKLRIFKLLALTRGVSFLYRYCGYQTRNFSSNFYAVLAAFFIVAIIGNTALKIKSGEIDTNALDIALNYRLSSPAPNSQIIILDIDEKSLADMAGNHGRWPWPREVLAEGLAKLNEAKVSAVAFNIMLSDPDIKNPSSDEVFNQIAAESASTSFPLIRLNPNNDKQSQIKLKMIKGVTGPEAELEKTIALLFPNFTGTHDKLGVVNLQTESDGVVRSYSIYSKEGADESVSMPSIVARVFETVKKSSNTKLLNDEVSDSIILNWRNKKGTYQRISFADYFNATGQKEKDYQQLMTGKIIVLGVSAPGIANVKTSPISNTTDDNLVIATAIDDLVSGSELKILPETIQALVAILFILALMLAFYSAVNDKKIEAIFAVSQIAILGITIISISYSFYLIDLTLAFMFSTAYFVVAKIYAEIEKGAYRGNKKFSKAVITDNTICHVICIDVTRTKPSIINTLKKELELKFGFSNVFYLDNVFGDGNLIEDLSETYHFFVYFAASNETTPVNQNEIQTGLTFVKSSKTEELQKQTHYLAFYFHQKSIANDDQIVFSDVALTMLKLVRFNLKNKSQQSQS